MRTQVDDKCAAEQKQQLQKAADAATQRLARTNASAAAAAPIANQESVQTETTVEMPCWSCSRMLNLVDHGFVQRYQCPYCSAVFQM